jgi:hypothetical protein
MPAIFLVSPPGRAAGQAAGPAQNWQYFSRVEPPPGGRWLSFAASVLLHLLALVLVPPITQTVVGPTEREVWIREMRLLRTLRIRVPEPFYLASAGPANHAQVLYAPARRRGAAGNGSRSGAGGTRARRRRLELPALPKLTASKQSLLQPQFPPELPPSGDLRLPDIFFWAPQVRLRTETRPFVAPGHELPTNAPRILDAPPDLSTPGVLSLSAVAPGVPSPALVLPRAAFSMPVRSIQAETARNMIPSADPMPGDATTVLSLAAEPTALREFLTVPPGNQVNQDLAAGAKRDGGEVQEADRAGNDAQQASGRPVDEALPPKAATAQPATADRPAQENDPVAPAANPAETMRATALRAAEATRMAHPAGGVFDVVVQSGGVEGFPESGGVLNCRPVYSVFLRVGSAKDWILQYCAASSEPDVKVAGPVVTLGAPSKLTAPYPQVTFRPVLRRRPGAYMMLHGSVGADGRFHDLRVLGANEPYENEVALAVLERWEFRPAARDGKPVAVEALLAIPRE